MGHLYGDLWLLHVIKKLFFKRAEIILNTNCINKLIGDNVTYNRFIKTQCLILHKVPMLECDILFITDVNDFLA